MVKPNFFFIGAPKCGTTSIAYTLSKHPNIFISNPKEPHFFEKEFNRGIKSLSAYESLFKNAKSHHLIIGEASTGYLFSKSAVPNILKYAKNPLFLVSIRNPYEMAISLHAHTFNGGVDDVYDFSEAWILQKQRRFNIGIPKSCKSNYYLLYKDRCLLGDQIERLFNLVCNDNILLVFFDDLVNIPFRFYEDIFRFLKLPPLNISNSPVLNKRMRPKFPLLFKLMGLFGDIKNKLGIHKSTGFANFLIKATSVSSKINPKIEDFVWKEMDEVFIPQIKKIEHFTGRDLSSWMFYRS